MEVLPRIRRQGHDGWDESLLFETRLWTTLGYVCFGIMIDCGDSNVKARDLKILVNSDSMCFEILKIESNFMSNQRTCDVIVLLFEILYIKSSA